MILRPPRATGLYTLFPYPTLFRSLGGEPAQALHEAALDLAEVERRVQRVAAVVQNVDALDPVFAGEGVDDDLRGSGAVGIVVERPALAGLAVPMDLRRLVKAGGGQGDARHVGRLRSEEHTSELQSLMRISYAVFCLKKKN